MSGGGDADRLGEALDGLGLADGCRRNHPVGGLTTYRVGGPAALFLHPVDRSELQLVAGAVGGTGVPVLLVGRGSNLLVADQGFDGVAIQLGPAFEGVTIDGTTVEAGGAASLPVVARRSVRAGLTGFEWAVGVPGSVGGAVRMNAGGHGADMAAVLYGVDTVDLATGRDRPMTLEELAFGYRRSAITPHQVVVAARLRLAPGAEADGEAAMAEIVRWRRDNQPGGPNAGSVFTNPPGDSAGRLIEAAGLKGLRLGTAEVSTKHANFIQADPGGSADDVRSLMLEVRRLVAVAYGVELVAETVMAGFPDPAS